jgi:hypothetical protein
MVYMDRLYEISFIGNSHFISLESHLARMLVYFHFFVDQTSFLVKGTLKRDCATAPLTSNMTFST